MVRSRRAVWMPVMAALAACWGGGGGKAAGADAPDRPSIREGIRWPGEGGKRIAVSVGITVIDFAHVDEQREAFEMAGYLDLSWTDPTLALEPGPGGRARRRFRRGDIWAPELEFVNATEQVESERVGDLYVDRAGRVEQRIRFSHKFRSALQLRRFPFDHQALTVVVEPFDTIARDVDLVLDEPKTGRLPGASIPDWRLDGESARIAATGDDAAGRAFLFEVRATRRSTFYFWRVFLPLALLTAVSWSVFWVDEGAAPAKFGTAVTVLVSLVAFSYTIDFSLPKVPYLTFADIFSFTTFAYVLSVIFAVTAIHFIHQTRGPAPAERLQRLARRAFPASFVAAIALEALIVLG